MNNRWRHKIKLRRKYKKKKKPKVRILKWGDILNMPGPTPQEIWDEFDRQNGIKRMGWEDLLNMKDRPSLQELCDEFHKKFPDCK